MRQRGGVPIELIIGLAAIVGSVGAVWWIKKKFTEKRSRKIADYVGFDPTYFRKAGHTMGFMRAKILADRMHDAVGVFNDNEEAMLSVIKEAGTAGNLSLISYEFSIRHKESMGGWVADYLDRSEETKQVIDALKNLKL